MRLLYRLIPCLLVAVPALAQTTAAPDISIRFSNDRILLGEPVWVVVTARNRSAATVSWHPGDYGFEPQLEAAVHVKGIVPEPARGNGLRERCRPEGGGGGSAWGATAAELAPGDSATWLFHFGGDFHFTQPGTYRAELALYGRTGLRGPRRVAPVPIGVPPTKTFTLQVLPRDDAALLIREKEVAAKADSAGLPRSSSAGWSRAQLNTHNRKLENQYQLQRGLATHPVRGMEVVFAQWQSRGDTWAIAGLKNLNTAESRAKLAELAKTPVDRRNTTTASQATGALGEMGDRQYYPLMVQLLSSQDEPTRRAAIHGVGYLGGDSAVATLVEIARRGTPTEQGAAMFALGSTQSVVAVRALIDLIAAPGMAYPLDAEGLLYVLTHHRMERITPRTTATTFAAWQQWWDAGGKNARVYSPFECGG